VSKQLGISRVVLSSMELISYVSVLEWPTIAAQFHHSGNFLTVHRTRRLVKQSRKSSFNQMIKAEAVTFICSDNVLIRQELC
jgi:hypothetical protein